MARTFAVVRDREAVLDDLYDRVTVHESGALLAFTNTGDVDDQNRPISALDRIFAPGQWLEVEVQD